MGSGLQTPNQAVDAAERVEATMVAAQDDAGLMTV